MSRAVNGQVLVEQVQKEMKAFNLLMTISA